MTRTLGWLALSLLCLVATTRAQEEPLGVRRPIEDPSGTFFRSLRRLFDHDRARIKLAFWGASHTASDQYTGYLRDRLTERFGDGGPGFFAPAPPYAYFDRRDVRHIQSNGFAGVMVRGSNRVADRYGLAGYALDATGAASARVVPRNRRIAHVEVYLLAQPGGGHVVVRVDAEESRVSTDSDVTHLAYVTLDVQPGRHAIELTSEGDGPVRVFGVLAESDRAGVSVDSFGVPGARVRDQRYWDEAAFTEHLARRSPDLYAIAYGTNESSGGGTPAEIEAEATAALARYAHAVPDAACLVIGPSDRPRRGPGGTWIARVRSSEMRDAFRRAAFASGCGFFDLLAAQGGAGGIERWVRAGWALDDHVHMTDEGHARIAEILERALLED